MNLILALAVLAVQDPPKKDAFVFDEWEAWNSAGVGSWIRFSQDGGSSTTPAREGPVLAPVRRTIEKKSDKEITLTSGKETLAVRKPEGSPPAAGKCESCGSVHKVEAKQSTEKVKLGGQTLECVVVETTSKRSDGVESPCESSSKILYHKNVPGWIVRSEFKSEPGGGWSRFHVLDFEKK